MHWTGAGLQLLALFAVIVSIVLDHWLPLVVFVGVVIVTYALIAFRANLVPMPQAQGAENQRYGNILLSIAIAVAVVIALVVK